MQCLAYKHIHSLLNDYDVFLFDIWGVIIEGDAHYPGVITHINQLIQRDDKKVFFVTNAPRTNVCITDKLQSCGIHATTNRVISSGQIALHMLLNEKSNLGIEQPLVYHFGRVMNDLLDNHAIATTTTVDQANIILLTLFCDETEKEILASSEATLQTLSNKKILTLCCNPDLGLMQQGVYRYCAGYFAEKIKKLGGEVIYVGKPYSAIYEKVLNQLPTTPKERILMIGDTFYTDILGANRLGIHAGLVLTGNSTPFHNAYPTLEEKLTHLTAAAIQHKAMPNFVVQLGDG